MLAKLSFLGPCSSPQKSPNEAFDNRQSNKEYARREAQKKRSLRVFDQPLKYHTNDKFHFAYKNLAHFYSIEKDAMQLDNHLFKVRASDSMEKNQTAHSHVLGLCRVSNTPSTLSCSVIFTLLIV